jgi:hypothetical protein
MVVICLMDSNLCGALGHKKLSLAGWASIFFRLLFALGAATSLALGAVLFMLEDHLAVRRTEQALSAETSYADHQANLHGLAGHAQKVEGAEEALQAAREAMGTRTPDVQAALDQSDACSMAFRKLKTDHEARSALLNADYVRLKESGRTDTDRDVVLVSRDLTRLRSALRDKGMECSRAKKEAARLYAERQTRAQGALVAAQARVERARSDQTQAEREAKMKIHEFSETASKAWSNNLSANMKAAWAVLVDEAWARSSAGVLFVLVVLIELSPFLGKLRLMNGQLSRSLALEEEEVERRSNLKRAQEHAREEALKKAFPEYERFQTDTLRAEAEIVTVRQLFDRVCAEAVHLREQREAVARHPDLRTFATASFPLALDKLLALFKIQVNPPKNASLGVRAAAPRQGIDANLERSNEPQVARIRTDREERTAKEV